MKRYDFEGQQRTTAEVHNMLPAYPLRSLRNYLNAGARNAQDVARMSVQGVAAAKSQARKNAAGSKARVKSFGARGAA